VREGDNPVLRLVNEVVGLGQRVTWTRPFVDVWEEAAAEKGAVMGEVEERDELDEFMAQFER
jgi:hypothetical protein